MKTKFIHLRNVDRTNHEKILPNGGLTICYVVDDQYKVIGYAAARCHEKDHYCKRAGRVKSAGRLKSSKYFQEVASTDENEFVQNAIDGYKREF